MKSVKLSQATKDNIRTKVVNDKMGPLYAVQEAKEQAFADRLLAQAQQFDLSSFPDDWFCETGSIRCSFDGWQKYLNLSKPQRQIYKVNNIGLRFRQGDPAYIEHKDLEQSRNVLDQQKRELKNEINTVLHAVTTSKRLAEVWPEAVEYLPSSITASPPPAIVSVDRLRELLA